MYQIKTSLLGLVLALVIFGSCSDNKNKIEEARAEVMKIHDDAMAELGQIRSAAFKLEEMAPSSADSLEIRKVVLQLEEADDAMMEWMGNYQEPVEDQLEAFFLDQKQKITVVADKMYASIKASKKYLNE